MQPSTFLAVVLNFIALLASPVHGLNKRDDTQFALYAYGTGIGGYSVMYKDGLAYAVGPDVDAVALGYTKITFSAPSGTSQLVVLVADNSTTFSTSALFGYSSSNVSVGFSDGSSSAWTTSGWTMFGFSLYQKNGFVSDFYAATGADENVFAIEWVTSGDSANARLNLRSVAPSTS